MTCRCHWRKKGRAFIEKCRIPNALFVSRMQSDISKMFSESTLFVSLCITAFTHSAFYTLNNVSRENVTCGLGWGHPLSCGQHTTCSNVLIAHDAGAKEAC